MKRSQGRSWFASLRRDGKPFALVASLVLLLALLQPLVPAAAMSELSVICVSHGDGPTVSDRNAPSSHRDCPCCVFGHACGGLLLPAKALTDHQPAFAPPSSDGPVFTIAHTPAVGRQALSGPPGIRAPPSF